MAGGGTTLVSVPISVKEQAFARAQVRVCPEEELPECAHCDRLAQSDALPVVQLGEMSAARLGELLAALVATQDAEPLPAVWAVLRSPNEPGPEQRDARRLLELQVRLCGYLELVP